MSLHLIGDTHLGKRFEVNVPLHRRGDRERMQWKQFSGLLNMQTDVCIQMGDLFDTAVVPYRVVYKAANEYRAAAAAQPLTQFFVLIGNHDASRNLEAVSAFEIFAEMVRDIPNLVVVQDKPHRYKNLVFIPWHPVITAKEMVAAEHADLIRGSDYAYGHWDVVMGDDNQLPAAELKALGITKAFTGHDHNARDIELEGLDVRVVGSMQPFSHAEDPNGQLYVTMTLADLICAGDTLKDMNVRVILEPDEVLETPPDCLSLQVQRKSVDDTKEEVSVEFEAFDLKDLFKQAVEKIGLSEEFANLTIGKLDDIRAAN